MSIESELAKMALSLLLEKPEELYEVLNEFNDKLQARKNMLADGKQPVPVDHIEMLQNFISSFGGVIQLMANGETVGAKQILEKELSRRMHGLPEGARFKID